MTSLIENLVAIVAPHRCITCSIEDNVICDNCLFQLIDGGFSICFMCGAETPDSSVCYACQKRTTIEHVWLCGNYTAELATMIRCYKFNRARAAAQPLAKLLAAIVPVLSPTTILVPIPTVSSHVRQRGYDHTQLLANELNRLIDRPVVRMLERRTAIRQVGATRKSRILQAADTFFVAKPSVCLGADIVIVDDVVTSGATLAAAAELLREAGARSVNAAVIARQR